MQACMSATTSAGPSAGTLLHHTLISIGSIGFCMWTLPSCCSKLDIIGRVPADGQLALLDCMHCRAYCKSLVQTLSVTICTEMLKSGALPWFSIASSLWGQASQELPHYNAKGPVRRLQATRQFHDHGSRHYDKPRLQSRQDSRASLVFSWAHYAIWPALLLVMSCMHGRIHA